MFCVTFLGHQGWLVGTARTRILVDPLLGEGFGHGGLLGRMYPPRVVDLAACPPIDAVVITHEHDDHFDIHTLNRLDRRIRVLLSERSSIAARTILSEMGFVVEPLLADAVTTIGDLRWHAFTADHRTGDADEWDVLPFVVHDVEGHGSFMSSVDVRPTKRMLERLPTVAPPGIWAYADNLGSSAFQQMGEPTGASAEEDAEALARVVARRRAEVASAWNGLAATLICGAGWSFPGERAVLDRLAFPLEPSALGERLRGLVPGAPIDAAVPGAGLRMHRGSIVGPTDPTAFVRAAPREAWPDRTHAGDTVRISSYDPACGRTSLSEDELHALVDGLADFARFLYGRPLHRALASLASADANARAPHVGFALRVEDRIVALVHDPTACRFVIHEGMDPMRELVSGIECWGSDLFALLSGAIGPTALCYAGRMRVWNAAPMHVRVSPHELWTFAHPLRRPDAALSLYRRLLAVEPEPELAHRVPAAHSF